MTSRSRTSRPWALRGGIDGHGFRMDLQHLGRIRRDDTGYQHDRRDGGRCGRDSTQITQSGNIGSGDGTGVTTVAYESPTPIYPSGSTHTLVVDFAGAGLPPVHTARSRSRCRWRRAPPTGSRALSLASRGKRFTAPTGAGERGSAGDYAVDIGTRARQNNNLVVTDADFLSRLNTAAAGDTVTFSLWLKHRTTSSSSVFSGLLVERAGQPRSADALPLLQQPGWDGVLRHRRNRRGKPGLGDDDHVPGLRRSRHVVEHVASRGGRQERDHQASLDRRPVVAVRVRPGCAVCDITRLYLGCGISGGTPALSIDGWLDDVAVYATALSEAAVIALHGGTAPDQIPGASSALAWWDFNDAPDLAIERQGDQLVITFSPVLQSSTSILGPFVDRFDLKSPCTLTPSSEPRMFFRARK